MPANSVLHVNINVTNLERSIAFYERLGFQENMEFAFDSAGAASTCAAFDLEAIAYRGVMMRVGKDPGSTCIDLVEWAKSVARPGSAVANSKGLYRVALTTSNVEGLLQELRAMGVDLLGPPSHIVTPGGEPCTIFAFRDPDGVVIEVVG